jgi:flagellar protein FlbD
MIKVTRLNGTEYYLNPHQIEYIESTPDTVISLSSGRKFIVKESVDKVIRDVVKYRQRLRRWFDNDNE